MSEHDVMINGSFNGEWKYKSTCWRYLNGEGFMTMVPHTCGYEELVARLSKLLHIDARVHDVVLTASANDALAPTTVTNDDNVRNVLCRYTINKRTVLCVNTIPKSMPFAATSTKEEKEGNSISEFYANKSDESEEHNEEMEVDELGDLNADGTMATDEFATNNNYANRGSRNHFILPAYVDKEIANTDGTMATDDEIEEGDGIRLRQTFTSRNALYNELCLHAVRNNFEISTSKTKLLFVVYVCKAGKKVCSWRLRAKRAKGSYAMIITKYIPEHTCGYRLFRHGDHRQATPSVIGNYFKENLMTSGSSFKPRDLQASAKKDFGVNLSYQKAYRAREKSIQLIQGSPQDSYAQLPAYLHMLSKKNPGTISDITLDKDGAFLYCFFSLGVCRSGFKWCRPIICVDGTHLKNRYHGDLLCAIALDANDRLYPVAFAIVDSENDDSYHYFMMFLRKSIGDVPGLVFVSDRHSSIDKAMKVYFPNAHHGICFYHLRNNMKTKFKSKSCGDQLKKAAYAYTESKFMTYFNVIRETNPLMAKELEKIGFSKWARAYFPGMRYAVLTNNYCESFNSKLRDARKWAITSLVEYIRGVLQKWHAERTMEADKIQTYLAPKMETALNKYIKLGGYLIVEPISLYEFWVTGSKTKKCKVDLCNMTCDCGKFNINGIPCDHVCAALAHRGAGDGLWEFCAWYFTTDTLRSTYSEKVYPCGDESEWVIPYHIQKYHVGVPIPRPLSGRSKNRKGRLKTSRIPSQGERTSKRRSENGYTCSKCNEQGHNKATCNFRKNMATCNLH